MVEIEKSVLESIGLAVLRSLEQPKDQNSAILLNLCKQQTKFMVLENISQAGGCEIFTDLLGNVDFGGCLNISFLDVDSDERINVDEIEWDADGLIGKAKYEKVAVLNESKEIEERVQFENVLRQAKEDAEKAHRTKSIFLENISQELRSPIDGIIGFIDVLFQTCLDESQKEILRLMQNSSKSMLWILNDIMDAAEIYGGAFTLQNHLFDLYQIIFDVVDVTNLLCVSKDIDLDIVMKGYVPQFVLGDSTRVKQILSNIMTNAAKYSEEGFVKLVVSYSGENGFFNFSVHDSGIGIAQHDTQKIFNSFSGIENNISSRSGNGAGLGLSMCKALAHLMGGSISVSSVLGKGSNFIVQLKLEISDQDLPSTFIKCINQNFTQCLIAGLSHLHRESLENLLFSFAIPFIVIDHSIDTFREIIMSKSNVTQNIVLFTSKEFFSLFKPQLLEELDYSLNNCILNIVVLCPSTYTASIHCSFSSIRVSKIFIPLRPLAIREFLQGINCIPIENSDDSKTKVLDEANNQIALLNYPLKTKPLHVAVIENSANNLRVAKRMLEKLGALVETSRTGTGIYDFIVDNHRSFDFILMDCRFPDMDGFETTLKIREYEKKNNLPRLYIIALSSYSLDSHLKKLQECGMDGALVKPVTYKMLAETVLSYKASSNPLNPTLSKISFKHVHNSMQNSASFSVLVVEDDEMTRWILTTQLNSIGCQVFEAVDGVSALQMMILGCSSGLQRQKLHINSIDSGNECEEKESLYFLDFVFMDCLMPGQDGFECTRMFRRYESKSVTSRAPIPVIGLTADSAFNTRLKCLNSGMNECILKPVSLETLVSILKKFGKYSPKHEKNLLP